MEDDILSIPDLKDTILEFGPHLGMSYEEALELDPQYCRGIMQRCRSKNKPHRPGEREKFYDFGIWLMNQEIVNSGDESY